MRHLVDRWRACLFWLSLADIYPNRGHRRHGWTRTPKEYR